MINHNDLMDFLDAFADLYFKMMPDGTILEYRGGRDSDTYVPPAVFLGKRMQDVLPGEIGNKISVALAKIRETGKVVTVEYFLVQNGIEGYFEARLVPYGEDRIVANVRDITNQRLAEKALDESEKKYAELVNHSTDVLFAVDPHDLEITFISSNIQRYGYEADELRNRSISEFIHRDDLENVYAELRMAFLDEKQNNVVFRFRLKDGTYKIMEESGKAVINSDGTSVSYTGILRDVTERMQSEEDKLRLAKMESLGLLAGGIAHDYNNLLCIISANISFALGEFLPASAKEGLQDAYNASRRAAELTRQLLTYSKGGEPEKKVISLERVVKETAEFCLRGSSIALNLTHEDLLPIDADEGQMAQIVQNIVINAKQAMPDGGKIDITLANHLCSDGIEWVCLKIQDNGPGIPKKHISKIFDPYFTTKQTGSGLGLAVTHSIINKHGGRIEIKSKIGKGTLFTIYLPATNGVPVSKGKFNSDKPMVRTGKILVMDDELPVANVLSRILMRRGHAVEITTKGETALDAYIVAKQAGDPFDLVIMDLTIVGGMGGKEAVAKLLKIDPEATVIVSSGYAEGDVLQNFEKYGFVAALPKPIDSGNLEKLVAKLLR